MNRKYKKEYFIDRIDYIRKQIPDISITTDLIVGFPNETDAQFQETLDLVDYCHYDSAFSFIYSPRSGTPAANFEDTIPMSVKKERLQILNERLAKYAKESNDRYLNKVLYVLCEGPSKKRSDVYTGYSEENKLVNFTGPEGLVGQIVPVKITKVHSFSLDGEAL